MRRRMRRILINRLSISRCYEVRRRRIWKTICIYTYWFAAVGGGGGGGGG
jgi:hypothetical protein